MFIYCPKPLIHPLLIGPEVFNPSAGEVLRRNINTSPYPPSLYTNLFDIAELILTSAHIPRAILYFDLHVLLF